MENIVLIGFMGAGKSTIGRQIANETNRVFVDTDAYIEKMTGLSIPVIFEKYGENYFRQCETQCLMNISKEYPKGLVLATGGGILTNASNVNILRQIGHVFYLQMSNVEMQKRLKNDTNRPLLQGDNGLDRAGQLLKKREPVYEDCAETTINTGIYSIKESILKIKGYMGEYMKKILIINGPNLNMLGKRDPKFYTTSTYDDLLQMIGDKGKEENLITEVFQSNHEGAIIDRIQDALEDGTEGLIINPGAYTHYSYAIHDALEMLTIPKVEIHISNIDEREDFRRVSVTSPACDRQIKGEGLNGYIHAINILLGKE